MAYSGSQLISVYTFFNFDCDDESYNVIIEKSPKARVEFTIEVADKTAQCFKEVNASRSTMTSEGRNKFCHDHAVWKNKGPFTLEQIMKIVQYEAGMSNDE